MKPSEAQVLGSTMSNLFSHNLKNGYTRVRSTEDEDEMEEALVHISEKRGPSCCKKLIVFFVAFLLLSALTGSILYTLGSRTYTVQVQIAEGNTMTYHFDQEVTITARNVTMNSMSGRITFWVANKTDTETWLHAEFSPTQAEHVQPPHLFALNIQHKDKFDDDSINQNYKLFGETITDKELAHHVHCILNQVLPVVKVKLYKAFLSRVRSSYKQVLEVSSPFLPGRVKLHQSLSSTDRLVTITNHAASRDFRSFQNRNRKPANEIVWKFGYNETTVLSKETGMAVNSKFNITACVPFGEAGVQHFSNSDTTEMKVSFQSTVKLMQEQGQKMKQKRFKHAQWVYLPLPKTLGHPQISYFAPQNKQSMALQELLNESARFISEGPKARFGKFPAIVTLRHSDSEFEDEDSSDEDESEGDDQDENDDWQTLSPPPPPVPDFSPLGYEDRRRRSSVPTNEKMSRGNLNAIWDELSASTLSTYPKRYLQVLRTHLFGMAVFCELEYQVKGIEQEEDEDDEEDDSWSIVLSFYLDIGPYRFTAFKKTHNLNSLRRDLLHKGKHSNVRHWKEKAGDLVVCASLFYLQKVCVEMRLVFALTFNYTVTTFSTAYPVELTVHIEHAAMVKSAMSAHVSTWFHKGGFYSTGGLARAKLPLLVSFREDARPEWCAKSNIDMRLIQVSHVPFAGWNCSMPRTCKGKNPAGEHSFKKLARRSPFWQNWHFLNSCEDEE